MLLLIVRIIGLTIENNALKKQVVTLTCTIEANAEYVGMEDPVYMEGLPHVRYWAKPKN